jgi:3-hydroxyacyl-[acyl-carrier-protein] dehydratase
MKKQATSFLFGPDVIRHLLPHRRPFLMVDSVTSYERSDTPVLCASRFISANESIFEGHFPGLHLWPGVYTIEGLGQACNLLQVIWSIQHICEERGIDPELVMSALLNLQRGFEMKPGYRPEMSDPLLQALKTNENYPSMASRIGMTAAVDIKLLQPVYAGSRLDFRVVQTHLLEGLVRFDVLAQVDGHAVARGTMTSTRGIPSLPAAAP